MRRGALLAAVLCFCAGLAVIAHADSIDDLARDEADAAFAARQANRATVDSALALITPTPLRLPAITVNGNVLIPSDAPPLSVTRDAPLGTVPERCREDAKGLPRGTILICAADDRLYKLATGTSP